MFATWVNAAELPITGIDYPVMFSTYTSPRWSTALQADGNTTPSRGVFTTYAADLNQLIATFEGVQFTYNPQYAQYNGAWAAANPISNAVSVGTGLEVSVIYVPGTPPILIAAWRDFATLHFTYSFVASPYTAGTWSVPATLASTVQRDVLFTYDSVTQQVFAAWGSTSPTYAIFNNAGGVVTGPSAIDSSGNGSFQNVSLAYNTATNQVFAAWTENLVAHHVFVSIYNGTTWGTPTDLMLIPGGVSSAAATNASLAYDSTNGSMFVAWSDETIGNPIFSINTNGAWSASKAIDGNAIVSSDIYLAYDPALTTMFAAWSAEVGNSSTSNQTRIPMYALFQPCSTCPICPICPPCPACPTLTLPSAINFNGRQATNNFGLVSERFNHLNWQTGELYNLYRNGTLIAQLRGTIAYDDHNRTRRGADTYSVIAVGAGTQSDATSITING